MGTLASEPLQFGPGRSIAPSLLREPGHAGAQVASSARQDHAALIYDNQEEQLDVIAPFLRLGIERGEKSVYIIDDSNPDTIIAAMKRHGIDVDASTATGALVLLTKNEAYLKNEDFDPDWMIAFLAQALEDAKKEGFYSVRASGEMTWALGLADNAPGRLVEYECKVDKFFAGYDMSGICQYNRLRFRPETLMHVIHTHPRIIFRGEICENSYYIPTEISQGFGDEMGEPVLQLLESMAENTRLRRELKKETEALRRTEKLAAAGEMAATIAHEINNPLEAVTNLWYLLDKENLSAEGRAYVDMMGKELARVSHITKQTLEFYRVGATKDRVDLGQIVEEAVQLFSRRAEAQGSSVKIENRAACHILGFSSELRQLFANLVVNALDAGGSRIQLRISDSRDWKKPARRGVRILITDNGTGIPVAAAAKAFEAFFTTKETKGTGLGLWVSKGIVHKHEGSIAMRTCTRAGASGTAFSIFLPAE